MKLFYTLASPYARKVIMLANLCGLENLQKVQVNPMDSEELRKVNPLGKVPALVDGELSLFESALICEYLDDQRIAQDGSSFYQRGTPNYYPAQKIHMQANGILDAAVATVMEKRRTDAEQSPFWLERWREAIITSVETLPMAHLGDGQTIHIGTIATVAALGYLDFRLPDLNWRNGNKDLCEWYDAMKALPWVQETEPRSS